MHKSGQLYIWGMGAAGRLGLDLRSKNGNPQKDVTKPSLVEVIIGSYFIVKCYLMACIFDVVLSRF